MDKPQWQMAAVAAFVVTMLHHVSDHDAAMMAATTADTEYDLSVVGESGGGVRWAWLGSVRFIFCRSTPREKM
jgi:hypothetical protein